MINCLGDPEPFVSHGTALGKRAELGMACSEDGTALHGGQEDLPEALEAPRSLEERYGLLKAVDRTPILTPGRVGQAEVAVRKRVQDAIAASRAEREGMLEE